MSTLKLRERRDFSPEKGRAGAVPPSPALPGRLAAGVPVIPPEARRASRLLAGRRGPARSPLEVS